MTFPATPVLDTFTDASAPQTLPTYSANWTTEIDDLDPACETVAGGTCRGSGANASAWWNAFSAVDVEVFATLTTKPADGSFFELAARTNTEGGLMNGYFLVHFPVAGTDTLQLWKATGGTFTTIRTVATVEIAAGDVIGMSVIGNLIAFFLNGVQQGSTVADESFRGTGHIGIRFGDTVGRIDDFGGGPAPSQIVTPDYSRFPKQKLARV